MTVQEFLDADSSYYDKFYLCIDDEYFDDGWSHLDECRDCIISNIEFDKAISLKELEIIPVSNPEEKIPVNVEILEPNTSFYIDCKTKFSAQDEYQS